MPPLVFVVPDGSDGISGGNWYNAKLLAALATYVPTKCMEVADFARPSLPPGTYLVDTLNLDVAARVLARREAGQHFVLLVHHLPSLEPGLGPTDPSLALEKEVLGKFDGFLATGAFTRDWLSARLPGAHVFLLEPAITVQVETARQFEPPLRAVIVCNLIPRKGILELLEALDIAAAPNLSIVIAGRTDLEPEYARACSSCIEKSESLSRSVTLLGPIEHKQVHALYQEANLFLSASRMETFGIALGEARYHGLPIFAVAGGNSENHLIEGKTGELFVNPQELAGALVRLACDPKRHELYCRTAWDARPDASETWQDGAERFLRELRTWFPTL